MPLANHPNILGRAATASSSGIGNVDGPASATDNAVVVFDGATGKIIKMINAGALIPGTNTLRFGATALGTIGVSADTTSGILQINAPSSGSCAFNRNVQMTGNTFLSWGATGGTNAISGDGSTTLSLKSTSATSLIITGGAAAVLTGGAGNMTIVAGSGNSRTLTLQSTTSGGTATSGIVMGDTQALTCSSLAGSGSRAVLADANGLLSAPVSDETWKENLRSLPEELGLDAVMALRPLLFNFKDKGRFGKQDYLGFGARATASVLPQVTGQDRDGVYYMTEEKLSAVLVKAVQQLYGEVKTLRARLA